MAFEDDLDAKLAARTPGKWVVYDPADHGSSSPSSVEVSAGRDNEFVFCGHITDHLPDTATSKADAELIALIVENGDYLVEVLRAAQAHSDAPTRDKPSRSDDLDEVLSRKPV